MSWHIELITSCKIDDVEEVFEWVEDECELSITPIMADAPNVGNNQSEDAQSTLMHKLLTPRASVW